MVGQTQNQDMFDDDMWSECSTPTTTGDSPADIRRRKAMVARLKTRFQHAEELITRFKKDCNTDKMKKYLEQYEKTGEYGEKRSIFMLMMHEYLSKLMRFPKYGEFEFETTLPHAAFRWCRHYWDKFEGQDGAALLHEAFSIKKFIDGVELDMNERMALITALFQSGKTFLAVALIIIYLACGDTPVVIVPKECHIVQVRKRLMDGFVEFVTAMKKQGFSDEELAPFTEVVYHSSVYPIDDENKYAWALDGSRPRCILAIKNYTHARRLNNLQVADGRMVLLIDEAHGCGGYKNLSEHVDDCHDEKVIWDREIFLLKAEAKKVILVTATATNILVSEHQLWSDCVFFKPNGKYYRGPEDIEYTILKNDANEPSDSLLLLSREEPPTWTNRRTGVTERHPITVLFHTDRKIDIQRSILQSFHVDNPEMSQEILSANWCVMTFQREGIRIWHASFMGQVITIAGVTSKDVGSGEHIFKGVQPSDILDYLGNNGGVERFPRIATIAYDMADEGTSFSSYNYPYWHTNNMTVVGKSHSSARLAQILNRLAGNHATTLPGRARMTKANKKRSVKEVVAHGKFIRELTSLKQRGNFQVSKYVKDMEVMENQLPARFVTLVKMISGWKFNEILNPNKKEEEAAFNKPATMESYFAMDKKHYEEPYKVYRADKREKDRAFAEANKEARRQAREEQRTETEPTVEGEMYGNMIVRPSGATGQMHYDTIMNHMQSRKGRWIPLSELRNLFRETTGQSVKIHLQDVDCEYGNRGLVWKKTGRTIEYGLN